MLPALVVIGLQRVENKRSQPKSASSLVCFSGRLEDMSI